MPRKKLTMEQLQMEATQAFRTYCETPISLPESLDEADYATTMDAILITYLNAYVAGFALANR